MYSPSAALPTLTLLLPLTLVRSLFLLVEKTTLDRRRLVRDTPRWKKASFP